MKPVDVLEAIERTWERRKNLGQLTGGPPYGDEELRLIAIVEDVRSLFNVGSILRTADGAGFQKVYLCGITGAPPRKEVTKTSLGAEDSVAWEYCRDTLEPLALLRRQSATIICLERNDKSRPLIDVLQMLCDSSARLPHQRTHVLVVGNEVTGLSMQTIACADYVCHLPMRGAKESLNVAVAFGIAAYQIADRFLGLDP